MMYHVTLNWQQRAESTWLTLDKHLSQQRAERVSQRESHMSHATLTCEHIVGTAAGLLYCCMGKDWIWMPPPPPPPLPLPPHPRCSCCCCCCCCPRPPPSATTRSDWRQLCIHALLYCKYDTSQCITNPDMECINSLTAIGAHERQLFDKLLWWLVTSPIFVRC